MNILREGMRSILLDSLEKAVAINSGVHVEIGRLEAYAERLEQEVFKVSTGRAQAVKTTPVPAPKTKGPTSAKTSAKATTTTGAQQGGAQRHAYTALRSAVSQLLPKQIGPYPDDIVALLYLSGERSAESVVATAAGPPLEEPSAREVAKRMFVRTLMAAGLESKYATDRELALETARLLEISCYNAAVRTSKESEEPPRRQWDSLPFLDIYSTRCGTINGLLDPTSSSCQKYGPILISRPAQW